MTPINHLCMSHQPNDTKYKFCCQYAPLKWILKKSSKGVQRVQGEVMLVPGEGSPAEGGAGTRVGVRVQGEGCGSKWACPPPNTYRRRGWLVQCLINHAPMFPAFKTLNQTYAIILHEYMNDGVGTPGCPIYYSYIHRYPLWMWCDV